MVIIIYNNNKKKNITRNKKKNITDIDQLSDESRALYMLITDKFEATLREMEVRLKQKDLKIETIERQLLSLKSHNIILNERIDEMESHERKDALVLSGDAVSSSTAVENTSDAALNILKHKLKIEIKPEDISSAFRIGKKPMSQSPDKRNIVLRFTHVGLRNDVLVTARRVKPGGLYVNENLTPGRSTILYVLRRVKKSHPEKIDACGSHDGKIYVWLRSSTPNAKNSKIFINSENKLENFLEKSIGAKLCEFLNVSDK